MIRWDTATDKFTPGQWMTSYKHVYMNKCMTSGDGLYFGYIYFTYDKHHIPIEISYKVKSQVPNFTAHTIRENHGGHWVDGRWDDTFQEKVDFPYVDQRGRIITYQGAVLYADGEVLYDASDHQFEPRKPMSVDGEPITLDEPIWE